MISSLRWRIVVAIGAIIVSIAITHWLHSIASDVNTVSYATAVLTTLTLAFVSMQLFVAFEQVEIAKRQTKLLERQDALLFEPAALILHSPDVACLGQDPLAATERLRLFVVNVGHGIGRGIRVKLALPNQLEIAIHDGWVKQALQNNLENYTVWERDFADDISPRSSPLLLTDLELVKLVFEAIESPILWQVWFLGGRSPVGGHFAQLAAS